MAQPDDIEIAPVLTNTYTTETSFIDNPSVTDEDNHIVDDFTAVSTIEIRQRDQKIHLLGDKLRSQTLLL